MNTENKQIAVICPNGIVKFYNLDGTRCKQHPSAHYNSRDLDFYKENYIVKFSN